MQNLILDHSIEYEEKDEAVYKSDVMQPLKVRAGEQSFLFFCFFSLFRVLSCAASLWNS